MSRLNKISPDVLAATIATEDQNFYSHPGFDLTAIVRAFWQNTNQGGIVSGASTITQQLARTLLLSPEERAEQSYMRKVREAILAAEITRRYSKDDILELYLNETYYGNLAYGIEAAAETYFQTTADKLTFAQAAFLAGLAAVSRHLRHSYQPGCHPQPHAAGARADVPAQPGGQLHLCQQQPGAGLRDRPGRGCRALRRSKPIISRSRTTRPLIRTGCNMSASSSNSSSARRPSTAPASRSTPRSILDLQDTAQALVTQQVANMASQNVKNGALVAMDPATGEILAMVGSPNFYDDVNAGQINMATSATRQPGSSIKPINYVAAFEKGWTPSTMIWDVPDRIPSFGRPERPARTLQAGQL